MRNIIILRLSLLNVLLLGIKAAIQCPSAGSEPVILSSKKHRLVRSSKNKLCLVSKITNGQIVPVARSNDGSIWHTTAGGSKNNVVIVKVSEWDHDDVYLPPIADDESYQLTSSIIDERTTPISDKEISSRFLEQATFGPTRESITELLGKDTTLISSTFPVWVNNQINNEESTSHRRFYRSRTATKINGNYVPGLKWHPCRENSFWRSYTFGYLDINKNIEVSGDGPYILSVQGTPRTVVDSFQLENGEQLTSGSYEICKKGTNFGTFKKLEIRVGNGSCKNVEGGNPPIYFPLDDENAQPSKIISLTNEDRINFFVRNPAFQMDEFISETSITDPICSLLPETEFEPLFVNFPSGEWFMNENMLALKTNTVDDPISDGGGKEALQSEAALCSNTPRTFLNSKSCKISQELSACGTFQFQESGSFILDTTAITDLYQLTKKYVYALDGLRADISPCKNYHVSRWQRIEDGACLNELDHNTNLRLKKKIGSSSDVKNPLLRDVYVKGGCDEQSTTPNSEIPNGGVKIKLDSGECWQHVHKDHLNVYDMTYWTRMDTHPGNKVAHDLGKPNPIKKWAKNEEALLSFPHWHPMSHWTDNNSNFPKLGRLGDEILFQDLPPYLRLDTVASHFEIVGTSQSGKGALVCGSPDEVANYPSDSPELGMAMKKNQNDREGDLIFEQRKQIWATIVLTSKDQLRQKLAWALSHILALTPRQIDNSFETESYLTYYDIFVRNAFGSYLDILREVSYSPLMGEMLTFIGSKSTAYVWENHGEYVFADENFAREIMQLFSVGTTLLNIDGTPKLNPETNLPIETYTNDEIESLARVWTGFDHQERRGNIENYYDVNRIDPMRIVAKWRDFFPKKNLFGGYIGDGVELCTDLVDNQHFLKKGAKYRLLGSSTVPEMHAQFIFDSQSSTKQIVLDSTSSMLYAQLCHAVNDKCSFPAEVSLSNDILCNNIECNVESVRIVKVGEMFYEYMRKPCTELLFYKDAKTIVKSQTNTAMCGNPMLPHASEACCDDSINGAVRQCQYLGERMTYGVAEKRCDDVSHSLCPSISNGFNESVCNEDDEDYSWTMDGCTVLVKVEEGGKVAVVHQPDNLLENVASFVHPQDSLNFFRVNWGSGGDFPTHANNCGDGACQLIDNECLCSVTVRERPVFKKKKTINRKDIETIRSNYLHIGARDPATFESGTFTDPITLDKGVRVHFSTDDGEGNYSTNTIIELSHHGKTQFYRNVKSIVIILNEANNNEKTSWHFRNPPHFMSPSRPERRDAYYETEEVLNHYVHHPNTAPFLAVRLIQRFGISNPSPRYVKAVAKAFISGMYEWTSEDDDGDNITFGSLTYGDLAATVAAILLHEEARSLVLEFDPSFGSLREPVNKLISFMRSMEYSQSNSGAEIVPFKHVFTKIGQMAHAIPSVFSFFLSEYAPSGNIKSASLVSPEAMVYTGPHIIGFLNGMFSMIKWGLSSCKGGFATDNGNRNCRRLDEGTYDKSWGWPKFQPTANSIMADDVVDELAMLLTSGRLSANKRQIVADAYRQKLDEDDDDEQAALRLAMQLILTTPEFHSTNLHFISQQQEGSQSLASVASSPPPPPKKTSITTNGNSSSSSSSSYKAIVYLSLHGGCDSYNILVPHSKCKNNKDMYDEYASVRGEMALNKTTLLPISVDNGTQICDNFGVHPNLLILQELYKDGDLVFLANTGHSHMNLDDKYDTIAKDPLHSYAHNLQRRRVQQVDPYEDVIGTGVLGRMADVLSSEYSYTTASFSVDTSSTALKNTLGMSSRQAIVSKSGNVDAFNPNPSLKDMNAYIEELNNNAIDTSRSGLFGAEWSSVLHQSIHENAQLLDIIENAEVTKPFPSSSTGTKWETLSKLIQSRHDRKENSANPDQPQRDVFFIEQGGYDTHGNNMETLEKQFDNLNSTLTAFRDEMIEQGVWDDIIVVATSDFGRTLTPNSKRGTDHAWGGNYFILGGDVDGSRIVGEYPHDLTPSGPLILNRGRVVPTTSWDTVFNGIAQWFGLETDDNLDAVLPNRQEFAELLTKDDLFE